MPTLLRDVICFDWHIGRSVLTSIWHYHFRCTSLFTLSRTLYFSVYVCLSSVHTSLVYTFNHSQSVFACTHSFLLCLFTVVFRLDQGSNNMIVIWWIDTVFKCKFSPAQWRVEGIERGQRQVEVTEREWGIYGEGSWKMGKWRCDDEEGFGRKAGDKRSGSKEGRTEWMVF